MAGTRKRKTISPAKAKQILREGEIGGKTITAKQKRFFGFVAGGGTPTKVKSSHKKSQRSGRATKKKTMRRKTTKK